MKFNVKMMNKNVYSLDRRVGTLSERIRDSKGDKSIIFLDTSAIIDFDKEVRRARLFDKNITTPMFYDCLTSKMGLPIYVTEHIYKEADQHTRHYVGGFPEICRGTFRIIGEFHSRYCDLLKSVSENAFEFDKVRYDVYWAGRMAFGETHKKSCRDPISKTDRELISTALWLRYASVPDDIHNSRPINNSVIVSSDCHISETSRFLMNTEFCYNDLIAVRYNGLSVVTSR